ncbi:MAG: hypothetical protein ABI855_12400, partial [Bacteroidota bacterium]
MNNYLTEEKEINYLWLENAIVIEANPDIKFNLMKRKIFLLLIIQTLFSIETIFGQIIFQKTFGGTGDEYGWSIQQTTDGGYVNAGYTSSFGAGDYDVYLIKINDNGDSLWTKTFGGTGTDNGLSVHQTTDGGYIITGSTNSYGAGDHDVYLIKTDTIGDTWWTKTFGGTNRDEGYSVQQTTDGGYIIAGVTYSFGAGYSDAYLIKTGINGDTLWTRTFGGTGSDGGRSVQQTTDGGYIITGYTSSFGTGSGDVYLIKANGNGNSLWTKTFGGTNMDLGYCVQQTTDGGYIIVGATISFGAGSDDVYLIKTNSIGNLIWSKTFGGTLGNGGFSVQQTTDGGYIITGYAPNIAQGTQKVYLIRTDINGDSLWTKVFNGIMAEGGNSVTETTDGGFIITGLTVSFGAGVADVYLIKTDSLGNSGCNEGSTATIVTTPATQVTTPATIVTSPPTIVTSPATVAGSGGIATTLCTIVGIQSTITNPKAEITVSPNPFSNEINFS